MHKILTLLILLLTFSNGVSQIKEDQLSAIIDEGTSLIHLSSSERIKEINAQLDTHWDTSEQYVSDSLKTKYYNYKGGLAIRKWEAQKAITYYNKAITYSSSDIDLFHYYLGVGVAHQILDQYDLAEKYLLKSLDYAKSTGTLNNEAQSLSDLANLYREKGNPALELKYIDLCLLLSRTNQNCELLKANYNILHGKLDEGLQGLWEVIVLDPEFEKMPTIYALMTLVNNYTEASGIDKAEELIKLILKNREQLHEGVTSDLIMKQGLIYKKRGMLSKAYETFVDALKLNQRSDFQNKVWLELYLLDENKAKYSDLSSLNTSISITQSVINGTTGDFIRMVSSIQNSSKSSDLNTSIKKLKEKESDITFQEDSRKLLLLYEETKRSARTIQDYKTYFLYAKKHDSLSAIKISKQQNLTNHFLNAQLTYYENQILNRETTLTKTETAFLKEKEVNKSYVIYLTSALFSFLLILILFVQTTLRKKKNQKLLIKIEQKNKELEKYTEEYEIMLLILSHHVKKPINQLYYSFDSLKDLIKLKVDKKVNFLVNTISDSTSELSNRIAIVLTLLKYRMNKAESIVLKKINLNDLINERISNFQNLNFQLKFDKKADSYIAINKESLSIIIDNALENVKKYNELGTNPEIIISNKNDEITLEIKNSIREKTKNIINLNDLKDSFGLGQKIIERLCGELGIKFDIMHQKNCYSLLFVFKLE